MEKEKIIERRRIKDPFFREKIRSSSKGKVSVDRT